MPTYAYACTDCGHRFDLYQAFTDEPLSSCPECGGRLRKQFGNVGVVFKGSGFYRNDARGKKSGESSSSSTSKDGASSTGTSDSGGPSSSGSTSSGSSTSGSGSSGSGSSGSTSSGSTTSSSSSGGSGSTSS